MEDASAAGPAGLERTRDRLRTALALATLVMLALSWPLWGRNNDPIARVPFAPGLPPLPAPLFALLLLGTIAATTQRFAWRAFLTLSLGILLSLILADQHRFQPWAYQFLVVGLLLVCLPAATALTYARWWFVSLYFYSGLSKLDASFCDELGNLFLVAALRPFGLEPADWPTAWRIGAILAMPAWELGVAAALLMPRTRRIGLAAALVLHAALLAILGPWGLGHSTIVLVWNAAMMVEVAILFSGSPIGSDPQPEGTGTEPTSTRLGRVLGGCVRGVFWLGVLLPLGERWGWFDTWPAHALYASHAERTEVLFHDEQSGELEPGLRAHLREPGLDGWRRLDLTGWSRTVRGVPVYPQGRACNGLAEAIAARYRGRLLIKVVQWGRAELWTGRRSRVEAVGWEAIHRLGNHYRLNAHPAGPPAPRRIALPASSPATS